MKRKLNNNNNLDEDYNDINEITDNDDDDINKTNKKKNNKKKKSSPSSTKNSNLLNAINNINLLIDQNLFNKSYYKEIESEGYFEELKDNNQNLLNNNINKKKFFYSSINTPLKNCIFLSHTKKIDSSSFSSSNEFSIDDRQLAPYLFVDIDCDQFCKAVAYNKENKIENIPGNMEKNLLLYGKKFEGVEMYVKKILNYLVDLSKTNSLDNNQECLCKYQNSSSFPYFSPLSSSSSTTPLSFTNITSNNSSSSSCLWPCRKNNEELESINIESNNFFLALNSKELPRIIFLFHDINRSVVKFQKELSKKKDPLALIISKLVDQALISLKYNFQVETMQTKRPTEYFTYLWNITRIYSDYIKNNYKKCLINQKYKTSFASFDSFTSHSSTSISNFINQKLNFYIVNNDLPLSGMRISRPKSQSQTQPTTLSSNFYKRNFHRTNSSSSVSNENPNSLDETPTSSLIEVEKEAEKDEEEDQQLDTEEKKNIWLCMLQSIPTMSKERAKKIQTLKNFSNFHEAFQYYNNENNCENPNEKLNFLADSLLESELNQSNSSSTNNNRKRAPVKQTKLSKILYKIMTTKNPYENIYH